MLADGGSVNISWQLLAYAIMTMAEVLISITCLEFSYTQSPITMKSVIMALYLMSVSLGNIIVSVVNIFIQNPDGTSKLPGASYYLFFSGLMAITAVVFILVAWLYKEKAYIQKEVHEEDQLKVRGA